MNWITAIQRAIDYTEEHLTEETDYEAIARAAASSVFHFQRIFSMLCGYTLGDYIRMRRLSLAADELRRTDLKIIDIALKYGYDSPESFSRAFTRFHGVTPSQARRGESVKIFSRLSVKLILTGGNVMNYKIVKRDPFKAVCKKRFISKPQGNIATDDISAFWKECGADGTLTKLPEFASFNNLHGILGICFTEEMANNGFPYGIGAEYNGKTPLDESLDIVEIPAHTFAVFECRGPMPNAFRETYTKICTEFFPQNDLYEYGNGIELEVYPSADVNDPNYYCEIWIAVQ